MPRSLISAENWITVISGDSRFGPGSLELIFDANTSPSPRTGTIRLLGQAGVAVATAQIVQSGASDSAFLSGIRVVNGLVQFTLNGPEGGIYIVQALHRTFWPGWRFRPTRSLPEDSLPSQIAQIPPGLRGSTGPCRPPNDPLQTQTSFTAGNETDALVWASHPTRQYRVQQCTGLLNGTWLDVRSVISPDSGTETARAIPFAAPRTQRFLRIQALRPLSP